MKQYLEVVLTALNTYRGKEEKVKLYKLSIYFSKLGDEQQNQPGKEEGKDGNTNS